MTFPVIISTGEKTFKMTVQRYYVSDVIDKYKVFAGKKELHLQSDIPSIERTKSKRRIKWQILSANFNIGTSDDAALTIQRLFRQIEYIVLPRKKPIFKA